MKLILFIPFSFGIGTDYKGRKYLYLQWRTYALRFYLEREKRCITMWSEW